VNNLSVPTIDISLDKNNFNKLIIMGICWDKVIIALDTEKNVIIGFD